MTLLLVGLSLTACGAQGAVQRVPMSVQETQLVNTAAEDHERGHFPTGAVVLCSTVAIGQDAVAQTRTRLYLLILCAASGGTSTNCLTRESVETSGTVTLARQKMVASSFDDEEFDPPYTYWIHSHFPKAVWITAEDPSGYYGSLLLRELPEDLRC